MKYIPYLYDSDPRPFLKKEVDFYIQLVKKYQPKNILELGVGTGRIFKELLNFVEYGVGIDNSVDMLKVCNKKCLDKDNYKLLNDNFVDFTLDNKFDFIYLPFNTFQHILHANEQIKCIKNIKNHLSRDGIFVLDVMNAQNIKLDFNVWSRDYITKLNNDNFLERLQITLMVDNKNIIHKKFKFIEYNKHDNKILQEKTFDALMKITPVDELEKMITDCGLKTYTRWSDYQFSKNNNSRKIIYLLRKHEN